MTTLEQTIKHLTSTEPTRSGDLTLAPRVALWILRMLVRLDGYRHFVQPCGFRRDDVASALGLGIWLEPDVTFDASAVVQSIRKLHAEAERIAHKSRLPGDLLENTARLTRLVELSPAETQVLQFTVMIHSEPLLDDAADLLGSISSLRLPHVLSRVLDVPLPQIQAALSPDAALARAGFVTVDNGSNMLRAKLDLLSRRFADRLLTRAEDPLALLRDAVTPSPAPDLALADFRHVKDALATLRPYLRHALRTRRRGVNVLFHGAPGTGKTQLARLLAQKIGCRLFEVSSEDAERDPLDGRTRLRAFRAAQTVFAKGSAMLLFDEIEDVFNDQTLLSGLHNSAQGRKAWINRMLETNPVPTIWITNTTRCLDRAFIRRFDIVEELPLPPRPARERILRRACGRSLPRSVLRRVADTESVVPALVTRAAAVAASIHRSRKETRFGATLEHLISGTLAAQGLRGLQPVSPMDADDVFEPALANTGADLESIARGLTVSGSGRLCLYGPPGTGKTAFGRWLSRQLGKPLAAHRVSSLVSPYVGVTEQNIARAFAHAQREGAILMIDEVDSFLQDRRTAHRSWEVTEVNEMLTQMEAFSGIFVASTNLVDGLDQAALRRFDLKLRFDYMSEAQVSGFLQTLVRKLGLPTPCADALRRVSSLGCLTPGDFAALGRRHQFSSFRSTADLIDALEQECTLKRTGLRKPIGFR